MAKTKPVPTHWPDLIAYHQKYIYSWAFRLTKDREDAEDLAQDIILKALVSEDKFEKGSNMKGWLGTMTKNLFITEYKKKKRYGTMDDVYEAEWKIGTQHCNSNSAVREIREQEVMAALDEIPEDLRFCLVGRVNGYRYEELAKQLGIPVGTIKNKIFRGRAALEEQFRKTKTTIINIPMAKQPEESDLRWQSLISLIGEKLKNGTGSLPATDLARHLGLSGAYVSHMLTTLVELKAIAREFGNKHTYTYQIVNLIDVDIEKAKSITNVRISKPKTTPSPRPQYSAMSQEQVTESQKRIKEKPPAVIPPVKVGIVDDGVVRWFDTREEAIQQATQILFVQKGLSEVELLTSIGTVRLEPKVELH